MVHLFVRADRSHGLVLGRAVRLQGGAVVALVNTMFATMVAALSWMFVEWLLKSKPSMLGAASGAVAGLVAITPASGYVGVLGALVIGIAAGVICYWAVSWLKSKLGYDDALDAFGIHCIGGIVGAMLTGVFVNPALGGTGIFDYEKNAVAAFDLKAQLISQFWAVSVSLIWSEIG